VTDLATLRAKLAAAERGEIGDPDPGQKVDHDLVDFLRFKIGQADTAGAFRREVAARDAAHSFDRKHAMNHAEALARAIRDAGGPKTTRAWQSPAGDTRVYLPEPAGYLSIGADGSVSETQRGKVTFYPSGLYREWARGVRTGREAYQASFRERMDRHAAEVVAAVAKVRGNPRTVKRGPVRRRPPKTIPFNPRATRTARRNPEAVPIASGLIVNPPVPTNDYRSAATRESTPLHIWWSNVLDLAGVTHAQSLPHRERVNRWYQAGEPAWMAADGLRTLARAQPRRNPAHAVPVIKRFTYLGTSDEVDACDCCGKSDLKSTVAIQDNDSGETLYFGTTCAARALKQTVKEVKAGTGAADRARAEAERARQRAARDTYEKDWHAYLAATGAMVRETYGPREWVGDNVTGGYQYPVNVYATLQKLGGMKAAREGFEVWKRTRTNPRRR